MSNRPTIALCVIAKDEIRNVRPMLESVIGCFDEIHFTDTGSTDGTVELVQKINQEKWRGLPEIKIHHFEWVNDFAKARNYSFSHATADYIAWIDLDDSLSDASAFIHWRDNVMHAAHYWVAQYNYSFKNGLPECKFIRERVIKRGHGFGWEFFVHEGIIQKEGKNFWPQRVSSWVINHRRNEEDRKQDHMRNLKIYDVNDVESVHPRMKFYLGKEYCENGFPEKAARPLMEAIKSKQLDPHDMILAIQYAAQSAFSTNHFDVAKDLIMNGLKLMPQRAEYWCLLGDTYCGLKDFGNAIYSYKSALNCAADSMGGLVVVYDYAYNEYPRIKLADIYLNAGDWTNASPHVEWIESKALPMAQEFRARINHLIDISTIRTELPKTDDVIITCPPHGFIQDWDENTLETIGHGGSETACIEVARWIKKKTGRRVKVFQPRAVRSICQSGVEYLPVGELAGYLHNVEPAAHIAWRHSTKLTHAKSYVWCHDLQCPGAHITENYDKIIALSEFHKNYLMETNGVPKDKVVLGFNGINPDDFVPRGTYEKDPLKVVFSSSPDRGIVQAIDIVKKARELTGLDIKLHTFYGMANMRKMGHGDWADRIQKKIDDNKDFVVMHGMVNKKVLMKHFQEAAVWLYCADFIESNCITAMEAMAAHAWPIVRDMGALKFTLKPALDKGLCTFTDVEVKDDASVGLWANLLAEAIIDKRYESMTFEPEDFSWEKVADWFIKELGLSGDTDGCTVRQIRSA